MYIGGSFPHIGQKDEKSAPANTTDGRKGRGKRRKNTWGGIGKSGDHSGCFPANPQKKGPTLPFVPAT